MRLRVEYRRAAELVADYDEQIRRGGLLVKGDPPPGTELFSEARLELVTPGGTFVAKGQIVQVVRGIGVAVAFRPEEVAGLLEAVEAARGGDAPSAARASAGASLTAPATSTATPTPTPPPTPAPTPPPTPTPAPTPQDIHARMKTATTAQKIQMALHGNKDERAAILRDLNKTLHPYVLRNPGLQLDEVLAIAKMTTVSPELLKAIVERLEWSQRPEIAIALVRNPKVPVPLALRLLDHVSPTDLRQLAKDTRTRLPIQQAARRKVLSP